MISNENHMQIEAIESREYYNYFFEIIKHANIKLDEYGIYKTDDINTVLDFLSLLLNKEHPHTANFYYPGFMTDITLIENIDNTHLFFHSNNTFDFTFKFKSMLILVPNNHSFSPLIFLESENDTNLTDIEQEHLESYEDKKYINIYQSTTSLKYGFQAFDEDFIKICKYISNKLVCFINFNCLPYSDVNKSYPNWYKLTSDEFITQYKSNHCSMIFHKDQ